MTPEIPRVTDSRKDANPSKTTSYLREGSQRTERSDGQTLHSAAPSNADRADGERLQTANEQRSISADRSLQTGSAGTRVSSELIPELEDLQLMLLFNALLLVVLLLLAVLLFCCPF